MLTTLPRGTPADRLRGDFEPHLGAERVLRVEDEAAARVAGALPGLRRVDGEGGRANLTPETRIGCYVGDLVSWLRPLEDHHVGTVAEVQRLLEFFEDGWQVIH